MKISSTENEDAEIFINVSRHDPDSIWILTERAYGRNAGTPVLLGPEERAKLVQALLFPERI